MRTIKCAHCGKVLFETDKPDGVAIHDAQRLGFIGKMPFLYGIYGVGVFLFQRALFPMVQRKHYPRGKR